MSTNNVSRMLIPVRKFKLGSSFSVKILDRAKGVLEVDPKLESVLTKEPQAVSSPPGVIGLYRIAAAAQFKKLLAEIQLRQERESPLSLFLNGSQVARLLEDHRVFFSGDDVVTFIPWMHAGSQFIVIVKKSRKDSKKLNLSFRELLYSHVWDPTFRLSYQFVVPEVDQVEPPGLQE